MNDATPARTDMSGTQGASAPTRASGSSFYTAMRILPRAQREAMFEIYSYCRLVDDVADSTASHAERRLGLAEWRSRIETLYAGRPAPELRALAQAVRDFSLRKEDFLAVIDGMDMDAAEDIRAPDWATLDLYCDRVASAVGRLSVRVFGVAEADGVKLAHHLGRALQLTNILRDIDEDAEIGRLYLPQEELRKAGIVSTEPSAVLTSAGLGQVCDAVAARALGHFKEADTIMARNPRRTVKAPRIMEEVYRVMLQGMMVRGWAPPRTRVFVSGLRLSWIAVQYAII
jgi:presqualene diphosphate synthase